MAKDVDRIRADLVIFGGGFMGLALARQAASRGLRSVIVEKNEVRKHHYMSGLIASRADYLRLDKDEVELTAYECRRWLDTFPDIVKPKLFIMPFNDGSPYSYKFLRPLMDYYDQITAVRLGHYYRSSFRINNIILEQMEPNLRKGYFKEALGFYELTANPDILLDRLRQELVYSGLCFFCYPDRISISSPTQEGRIRSVGLSFNDRDNSFLVENQRGLTVVNCAGPWMQDVSASIGINLPVEYSLGFQLSVKEKYLFQHSIITFGPDDKYAIISQNKDHVQVGPTNTLATGPEDIENSVLREKALQYLSSILKDTIETGIRLSEPRIKSGGLRVKLSLPFAPDSNRPFIINIGFENYHVLYPGKAVLALRTADEFLDKIISNKKFSLCLNGNKKTVNWFKLNYLRLKSLAILGFWYFRYYTKPTLHP